MGIKLKTCIQCGREKKIGQSKKRCKACRKINARLGGQPQVSSQPSKPATKKKHVRKEPVNKNIPYSEYLKSEHWQKTRARKLRRANYKCERCLNRAWQVHHKHYKTLWRECDSDLEAICGECHKSEHECLVQAESHMDSICGR